MKGKALRRAIQTTDVVRINSSLPLITDTTEIITPQLAEEMLKKNRSNRPVNWKKVEEYATIMQEGQWELHAQGIILDPGGNIITGQTRLWAVIYSGVQVPMRISRGNPAKVAKLIDRGRPQSARDLASRDTEKKHSPIESTIARVICALNGNVKPSVDELGEKIAENSGLATVVLEETRGTKKTRAVAMILGVICFLSRGTEPAKALARKTPLFAEQLEAVLLPHTAEKCWGKGAAFGLAVNHARQIVEKQQH